MGRRSLDRRAIVVCPVLPYPAVGGSHKRTLRLIEAIERAGAEPHLLTTDSGQAGAADELRARGWVVQVLAETPPTLLRRVDQHLRRRPSPFLPEVARRLAELAPEAGFVQFEHPQSAYYLSAARGMRTVLSLHNVDSEMLSTVATGTPPLTIARLRAGNRSRSMRSLERRTVPRVDAVLCVSEHDCRHFEPSARLVLEAPNGVDEEFFAVSSDLPDGEDIVFFGQFDYPPNELGTLRFLREGWPRLAELRPAARLLLAGKGTSPRLAAAASAAARVEMLGFVDDLPGLLARSRLVLVPLWHGGGTRLKVLESLAAARPLVGTPLGIEEIGFRDGEHGLVAERPEELAELAAALLVDRPRSTALAAAGRELSERYRWPLALAAAEDLYRRLLADSPPPRD